MGNDIEIATLSSKDKSSHDVLSLFVDACDAYSEILKGLNLSLSPTSGRGLDHFHSLPNTDQLQVTDNLLSNLKQVENILQNTSNLEKDNRRHAWWYLQSKGLIPPEDLFGKIGANDIIEILDADSKQLFRSFEIFSHISYSLSEMFTYTWMDLFERDEFVFRRIFNMINDVLSGKLKYIVIPNCPVHVVKERFSEGRHWVKMQHKIISPLYDHDGAITGVLVTFTLLDSGSEVTKPSPL